MSNNEHLFTDLNRYEQDTLEHEKQNLTQRLSQIALRLAEIERNQELETPPPVLMRVSAAWLEFEDDGYIGGFNSSWRYPKETYDIEAQSLEVAFLAALASQPHPINTHLTSGDSETNDHLSISLRGIRLMDDTMQQPPREIYDNFNKIPTQINGLLDELRQKAQRENPYKDIPIKINRHELEDVLLRKVIFDYCQTTCPGFSVKEVKDK